MNLFFHNNLKAIQLVLLLLLVTLVGFIYTLGNSGAFYYDDFRPLSGLVNVTDLNSALIYITTEISGTLGRPIAMISFLFNINDWPNQPENFFNINIFIHCLNGIWVFFLSYFLSKLYCQRTNVKANQPTFYLLALASAAFWLTLPIHTSTSLIAIQRMASLSAFFIFMGLTFYVYGLNKQNNIPQEKSAGLYWQITGLFLCTLLAMFTKENGILLPVFVLVIECTLLNDINNIQHRRNLRVKSCALGLLVILGYLLYAMISSGGEFPNRDFSLIERLMTQPLILLDYIRLAFVPDVASFNPFHDNVQKISSLTSSPFALFAALFWLTNLSLALYCRKRWPLFSFAILWFLVAHLLESTSLNLELYFEHRNYVAMFGPCLAIVLSFFHLPKKFLKVAITLFVLYWIILMLLLIQTTKLWGNSEQAAEHWFIKQPGSARATEHLAMIYLEQNRINEALGIVEFQVKQCPDCISSVQQALLISCVSQNEAKTKHYYQQTLALANKKVLVQDASIVLAALNRQIKNTNCQLLTVEQLKVLNEAFLSSEIYDNNISLSLLINLHQISVEQEDTEENINLLWKVWTIKQDKNLGRVLISNLLDNKQYDIAKDFANNKMCEKTSINPLVAKKELALCAAEIDRVDNKIQSLTEVR